MSRIFAFTNQKGGVGKTTSSAALAAASAELGKRVLLVDVDPQAGLTTSLGFDPTAFGKTVYHAFTDSVDLEAVTCNTGMRNVTLIPANLDLAAAEAELIGEVAWERTLKDALAPSTDRYDLVVLDCPPSLGVLTTNAIVAADTAIVPLQCEYLALRALKQLQTIVNKIRRKANPGLCVRILRTLYSSHTLHGREVFEEIARVAPDEVLQTYIKRTVCLADAAAAGETILSYATGSDAARAYRELAKELEV
ncbi:MAG: ParA family protein [Deltaproteobacteria bacterium]|nr:ParA family protein [Deltaproteobacteria bacterium]